MLVSFSTTWTPAARSLTGTAIEARHLPANVRHIEYAPFRKLFPRCTVVVHHGGIGTIAAALASGTPQLLIPQAYDQFDNAIRVRALGAGDWLKPSRPEPGRIAAALRSLMTPEVKARCLGFADRLARGDALGVAAGLVEALADHAVPSRDG